MNVEWLLHEEDGRIVRDMNILKLYFYKTPQKCVSNIEVANVSKVEYDWFKNRPSVPTSS